MADRSATAMRLGAELREPTRRHLAITEIAAAFEAEEGNATRAARRLGVSHRAIMRWISERPALARRVDAIRRRSRK